MLNKHAEHVNAINDVVARPEANPEVQPSIMQRFNAWSFRVVFIQGLDVLGSKRVGGLGVLLRVSGLGFRVCGGGGGGCRASLVLETVGYFMFLSSGRSWRRAFWIWGLGFRV